MTGKRFKQLCNLITSEEFLEFLNTITTQYGTIYVTGESIKTGDDVKCSWNTVKTTSICIQHGNYHIQNNKVVLL